MHKVQQETKAHRVDKEILEHKVMMVLKVLTEPQDHRVQQALKE